MKTLIGVGDPDEAFRAVLRVLQALPRLAVIRVRQAGNLGRTGLYSSPYSRSKVQE